MFKSKFHYILDSEKNLVTVRPTNGTILKAFLPTLIPAAFLGALYLAGLVEEKKEAEAYEEHMESIPKD